MTNSKLKALLPPLPAKPVRSPGYGLSYSNEQLDAYAQKYALFAMRATVEHCAKVCNEIHANTKEPASTDEFDMGYTEGTGACWAAIRAILEESK